MYSQDPLVCHRLDGATSIRLAPGAGCNVVDWTCRGIPILAGPDEVAAPVPGPLSFGNPVLFPSVGRTWDRSDPLAPEPGSYFLAGCASRLHMPPHGLAGRGTWRMLHERRIDGEALELGYEWTPTPAERLDSYPFDVALQLDFRLENLSLAIAARVINRGDKTAPFALGYHPYFRITDVEKARIRLACREELLLDPKLCVPTGSRALDGEILLTLPTDQTTDRVFTRIAKPHAVLIENAGPEHDVRVSFDAGFDHLVIFHRAHAGFICIEPWTRGLGGFSSLRDPGWEQFGALHVLPPGGCWQARLLYEVLPRGGAS